MSDFMGDNGVHLMWIQKIQQGARHQNIAKPLYQSHDTGSNDSAFKNRPVENVPVSQIYRFTEAFDTCTMHTLFQGPTTPEFLDQKGAHNGDDNQKDHKVDYFAFRGGKKAC